MSAEPNDPGDRFGPTAALLREIAVAVEELGDTRAASALRDQAERGGAGATVAVVVGEKKRGKSSLINALLGRPGLLPVDVDVATGVHIGVGHADPAQARAFGPWPEPRPIGLDQVGEYGALDPVTAERAHPEVTHLEVGIPDPLLESGLMLVDTPGVGGLVSGHAALTLAALTRADALVFVISGASELTASECAFLEQATERVATVLFVLTQTDKYPGWRQVLQRSQDLVREHAPRFADAPWFPVSNRLHLDALRAREAGQAAIAAEREEAGGIPVLAEALRTRVAGPALTLRRRNAHFLAGQVLAGRIAGLDRLRQSLVHDPRLVATIEGGRDRLAELLRSDAQWRTRLAERFKLLDRELNRTYQRMMAEFQAAADHRLAEATPADAAEAAREFEAGIQAVRAELQTAAQRGAERIADGLAREFAEADALVFALDGAGGTPLRDLPALEGTAATQSRGVVGFVERFVPGLGAGSLLTRLLPLGAGAFAPFMIIAVGGVVGNMLYQQRRQREAELRARGDLHRYLQKLVRQTHAELPAAVQDGLEGMLRSVERAMAAAIAERRADLERELTTHLENLKASDADLAPRREQAEAALVRLRALAERAAAGQ